MKKPDVIFNPPVFGRNMDRVKGPVTYTDSKGETHTSSIPVVVTKESLVLLEKLPQAKVVIRPNEDGIDVNYGPLVAGNLDGIPFVAEDWYLDMLKLPYVIMDKIPEFLLDFKLDVELSVESGRKIIVHILDKADIRQLAVAFSKVGGGRWVGVHHKCRWLETFENGHVVNGHQTIDEFYTGMTAEQIEHSKY